MQYSQNLSSVDAIELEIQKDNDGLLVAAFHPSIRRRNTRICIVIVHFGLKKSAEDQRMEDFVGKVVPATLNRSGFIRK